MTTFWVIVVLLAAFAATTVGVIREGRAVVRLADPAPTEAERIREALEHQIMQAELEAWLDEVTGQ